LSFVAYAFLDKSTAIPWLIIVSNLFLGGVLPCINAMLTDIADPEKRKAAFPLIYLGTNIGVAIEPIVAGFLFNNYIRLIFLLDAAVTLISLIPVMMGYFIKHYGVTKVWPLIFVLAISGAILMYILYLVESNKKPQPQ